MFKFKCSRSSKSRSEANLTKSNRVLNDDPRVAKTIRRFKKSREIVPDSNYFAKEAKVGK